MDVESIAKGLTSVGRYIVGRLGFEQAGNMLKAIDEAVAMLKEQEAVTIVWKFGFPHCPICGQMLPEGDAVKYCLHCGRSVKWE